MYLQHLFVQPSIGQVTLVPELSTLTIVNMLLASAKQVVTNFWARGPYQEKKMLNIYII
jgi:hypothetical protein